MPDAGCACRIISFILLAGNFWDKLHALFVREATVNFPQGNKAAGS
jgi:hypothetical protein